MVLRLLQTPPVGQVVGVQDCTSSPYPSVAVNQCCTALRGHLINKFDDTPCSFRVGWESIVYRYMQIYEIEHAKYFGRYGLLNCQRMFSQRDNRADALFMQRLKIAHAKRNTAGSQ